MDSCQRQPTRRPRILFGDRVQFRFERPIALRVFRQAPPRGLREQKECGWERTGGARLRQQSRALGGVAVQLFQQTAAGQVAPWVAQKILRLLDQESLHSRQRPSCVVHSALLKVQSRQPLQATHHQVRNLWIDPIHLQGLLQILQSLQIGLAVEAAGPGQHQHFLAVGETRRHRVEQAVALGIHFQGFVDRAQPEMRGQVGRVERDALLQGVNGTGRIPQRGLAARAEQARAPGPPQHLAQPAISQGSQQRVCPVGALMLAQDALPFRSQSKRVEPGRQELAEDPPDHLQLCRVLGAVGLLDG